MIIRTIYKVLRSILFSVTLFVVGLYVLTYTLLSIPSFTNWVKDLAVTQISDFLGGEVIIDEFDIYPFNEVKISGLEVLDPNGMKCLSVETVGAGISLWKLFTEQSIELTFGEIIGLDASIVQPEEGAPLNIDFILKAFAPKDENKEKKPFELALRNVVLRKSRATFSRPWLREKYLGEIDLSHLEVSNLAADVSFPKISDKGIEVDLRRLSMEMSGGIELTKLGLKGEFSAEKIEVQNFILEMPDSRIFIPEISLNSDSSGDILASIKSGSNSLEIVDSYLSPADFAFLYPALSQFPQRMNLELRSTGNIENIRVEKFNFGNPEVMSLTFNGEFTGLPDIKNAEGHISELDLYLSHAVFTEMVPGLKKIPTKIRELSPKFEYFELKGDFIGSASQNSVDGEISAESNLFALNFEGKLEKKTDWRGNGELNIENLKLQDLVPSVAIGNLNANLVAEGSFRKNNPQGMLSLVVEDFEYKGKKYEGLSVNISKEGEMIDGDMLMHNDLADIEAKFGGDLSGEVNNGRLDMDLSRLNLSEIIDMKQYEDYLISGIINFDASGRNFEDITGDLSLSNFSFVAPDYSKSLRLKNLRVIAEMADSNQNINLKSDWVDIRAEGPYKIKALPGQLKSLAASVFPALIQPSRTMENPEHSLSSDMDFDIVIKRNNTLPEFFNLPVRLLVPVSIAGTISGTTNSASLTMDVPYLQQGKDKLIYDTKLILDADGNEGTLNGLVTTTMPVKRGDLALKVDIFAQDDEVSTDIHWRNTENPEFYGLVSLLTEIRKNNFSNIPDIFLTINPSVLNMGPADWHIERSRISYSGNTVDIDGLKIWHDEQSVEIAGKASKEYADAMNISLHDIDVDYVFDLLQINYVTFGGVATGEITGHSLLSGDPVAETDYLLIREFTYNGCNLGECIASSRWNNDNKEIEISADIRQDGVQTVFGDGGIWIGKDSLSFDINAKKVPVDFVQPFMAVFSSEVKGKATGDVKLFGTFHDIDMTGRIFADSVAVKLDYTNTVYHGSDSVFLSLGKIEIPHFRLYDKYGNSGVLTGELTHRYFHDPSFTFRLADAENLLCYDTSADLNPDWYGTLFGSGSAFIQGLPGLVDISADMTLTGNSAFTFVLNETQYAQDYQFLTFSDRNKPEPPKLELTADDFKAMLKKKMQSDAESLSKFGIDIRASVTPQVLFTLVMDPIAGDKISARGSGAMQVKYESDNDEMMMYGKYEIDEGNYNFSLQDIILRDFKIKEGSYISFNGNPLAADLDISATYRVNTNLSDLDKSFSTDRDLNRTNVPVDAVLMVNGSMQSPDITFDIELPTLTQDVERKVKSIISTDDMMNRQIIYLLALNRFYTPEYMGATGNGGELAAVASTTISSQLSNILGQLTDKFSVSPSFRSDKGDFSDLEVDVALSSKLLNNRLLINGNFGYRDRSTSSTTFVGDFDVEYLLSKNGNLRLKAYNHFNDQNYYLREALTTQGLGLIFRRDW